MSGALQAVFQNQRSFSSPPVNTAVPTISGTVSIGQVLTSTTGTWTGVPTPTFAYQWQRGTTNIGGATSSTYTIQLSDASYTLRCVVTATNSAGSASANSANTSTVPLPAIGSALGGGYYAGQISTTGSGVADYFLIVAPLASGQSLSKKYKSSNTAVTGADSLINGAQNTADMVAAGAATVYPAAHFCNDLVTGGYSDWYMPSRYEQNILYFYLKPGPQSNYVLGNNGANPYSVPTRTSGYTAGNPTTTTASAFVEGQSEAFTRTDYYSSSESSTTEAWDTDFSAGQEYPIPKNISLGVRAVRKVAV